jgi:alanine-glyoxylate transaminase/serine-glyoxylate transaminase/serine-pyruvate transaminase
LFVVDTVTSLGGLPVQVDALGIDAAYSGTQKCLACPPGLAPVTLSERACAALAARKQPLRSWYLDLSLVGRYWGEERVYHHTAPVNMLYALHEALRLVLEEGLEARFRRHRLHHAALVAGFEGLGLGFRVRAEERLPPLTTVRVPDSIDDARARRFLLDQLGLEIGAGLGPMKGNTWRVGLMGHGASRTHVELCLTAIAGALRSQGHPVQVGAGLEAAAAVYARAE